MIFEQKSELIGCVICQERLHALMGIIDTELGTQSTIDVTFFDGGQRKEMTKDVFNDQNFSNTEIKRISIYGSYDNYQTKERTVVSLWLSSSFSELSISSTDYGRYSILKTKTEEWLTSVRPKGREKTIAFLDHDIIIPAFFGLLLAAFSFIGAFCFYKDSPAAPYLNIILPSPLLALWLLSSLKLLYLIQEAFPKVEINVGFNKFASKRKKYLWFLTVIVIPLVFMIVGLFLKNPLS